MKSKLFSSTRKLIQSQFPCRLNKLQYKKFCVYFKESLPYNYTVLPPGDVPAEFQRPNYMLEKNFNYEDNRKYAIHMSEEEINNHRKSCKITASVLQVIEDAAKADKFETTEDIDKLVHQEILKHQAYPTAIGYMGFPKSVCTSVNESKCFLWYLAVVHGIPNTRKLLEGDTCNVDVTNFKYGYHGDSSIMISKGKAHEDVDRMSIITREAMYKAIKHCKPGERVNIIGEIIEDYIRSNNYFIVNEFCGHGVGADVHMNPFIYHFSK